VNTTEALRNGTALLADTASQAMTDIAERARHQAHVMASDAAERLEPAPKDRRGRRLLFGAALVGAAVAAVQLVRRTALGRKVEERVIDLTGRTDEATFERLVADGLDPVAMGGL